MDNLMPKTETNIAKQPKKDNRKINTEALKYINTFWNPGTRYTYRNE